MTRVGAALDKHGPLVIPGVFDCLSAITAARAQFPLMFISGYSVSASLIGEPDLGLLTQTEVVAQARRVCGRVDTPVIVDADTGYGNVVNVQRTVSELIRAGAAGCFIEDQVWPKRCGHMRDKAVIERGQYVAKIHAAVDARGDRDFFIVARTDSLATNGADEALRRMEMARDAGADGFFIEAPHGLEDLETIGSASPGPRVANMIEGGKTPLQEKARLAELGFHLLLYPLSALFACAAALQNLYAELAREGTTRGGDERLAFDDFNALIGVEDKYALERRYGE